MLTLFQFPGPWDVCSASPFCAKLEAFLRWQDIPYNSVTVRRLKGAPRDKLPYIEDEQGKLGDSTFIIDYLIRSRNLDPDAGLSDEQRAVALGLRNLCEDNLYWALVWLRWVDEPGWIAIQRDMFGDLAKWKKWLILPLIRDYVRRQLRMQGMGRYTRGEIMTIACADLRALSDFLGDKTYFFGDTMTTTDLVVFSLVSQFLTGPQVNAAARYARRMTNLVAHTARVRERCFGVNR